MTDTGEIQRVDFLAGQVHGLLAFALTVINIHPDPANFQAQLEATDLSATGRIGAELVSDVFLEGMADIRTIAEGCRPCPAAERGSTYP
jgi:hypothetical protein